MALFIDVKDSFCFLLLVFTLTCCQVEHLWRMVAGYIASMCQKYTVSGQLRQGPGEGHSARSKCPFSVLHHSVKMKFGPRKVEKHTD